MVVLARELDLELEEYRRLLFRPCRLSLRLFLWARSKSSSLELDIVSLLGELDEDEDEEVEDEEDEESGSDEESDGCLDCRDRSTIWRALPK